MLNKAEMPQKYTIFRQKSIGRRLVRPDGHQSNDKSWKFRYLSENELEAIRFQLYGIDDCLSQIITDAPQTATGKIIVDPRDFKHLLKCLGVLDIHLDFMSVPGKKGGPHES